MDEELRVGWRSLEIKNTGGNQTNIKSVIVKLF